MADQPLTNELPVDAAGSATPSAPAPVASSAAATGAAGAAASQTPHERATASPDALAAALDAAAAETRAAAADVAELSAALTAEASTASAPDAISQTPRPDTQAANAPTEYSAPDLAEQAGGRELASIELLDDVELDVKVELGRADMYIEDVLKLGVGSVVELNKLAGDPVDIYVNERLIARGEVLVLNDSFCVRVNEIVSPVPELAGNP